MGLPKELLKQFAKAVKPERPKTETIVNGTIAEKDGVKYLMIDGSEALTPIATTVDMVAGERVTAMIKNHTAVVTGNISSPAARSEDVKTVINGFPTGSVQFKNGEVSIGDHTTEELMYNLLVGLSAVYIRNGGVNIAKFASDIVELANTETDLNIYGRAINYYVGTANASFKPYYEAGDTITISNWYGAGYVTNSGNTVAFTIPLAKPVIGNPTITVDWTGGGLVIRQGGSYKFSSEASKPSIPGTSTTATLDGNGSFVDISAVYKSTGSNNAVCGIRATLKIILSASEDEATA